MAYLPLSPLGEGLCAALGVTLPWARNFAADCAVADASAPNRRTILVPYVWSRLASMHTVVG